MSLKINKEEYIKLIEQDLKVLSKNCKESLELDHIKMVLCNSIDMHYPERKVKQTGIELIAEERREQIEKHGFSNEHDSRNFNSHFELTQAACYLLCKDVLLVNAHPSDLRYATYPSQWNYEYKDKFDTKSILESLKVAGALIAAEIDRIQASE